MDEDFETFDPEHDDGYIRPTHDVCNCGRPKQVQSKTCRTCWLASRRDDPKWKGSASWTKVKERHTSPE